MNRQELARAIKATATYYGRQLDAEVLSMMCDDLADLDPAKCIEAYSRWRRNPANRTFPLPAQIRELVNPEQFISCEARAREIAARITAAIPKFGWSNGGEAKVFIGPEGWDVVQRQGGWAYICENHGLTINPTAFQAQVRDQVEASLKYGTRTLEHSIGARPEVEARKGELLSFADVSRKLLATNDDSDPKGAA